MKLHLLVVSAVLLLCSQLSQAAVIQYNGFSRDESSTVIQGGGYEWLMWTETNGLSVNQATATYGGQNWVFANSVQVVNLFNAFSFGLVFTDDNSIQTVSSPWNSGDNTSFDWFLRLFGINNSPTASAACTTPAELYCWNPDDLLEYTRALYQRNNGSYGIAYVETDSSVIGDDGNGGPIVNPGYSYSASLDGAGYNDPTVNYDGTAVIMLRAMTTQPGGQVPTPSTLPLLLLGVLLLLARSKTTKT